MCEPYWTPLGGQPVDYEGAWSAGTQYAPGDVVVYGGITYLAVNPSLGVAPPFSVPFITPTCRVYRTTAQSITSGTPTAISFDAERFDTDAIHDLVTNPTRLTCRTAGKYLITGAMEWGATTSGTRRQGTIILNGVTPLAVQMVPPMGVSTPPALTVVTVADLVVNDYVELQGYQDSGAALNVLADPQFSVEMGMVRVA